MAKLKSAGLLMYRRIEGNRLQVLVVHPGGPFWAKKDDGSWFIPKGEIAPGEDELAAAKREFEEETSFVPAGSFVDLGDVKHKSGKVVRAWAFEGNCDPRAIKSNTFSIEWPPKSGKQQSFPEVDRAAFMDLNEARQKVYPAEYELINRLRQILEMESST